MTTLQEQPRPVEDHWCPNRDKPSPGGDDCLICARWWRDNCPSCPAYRSKWEEAEYGAWCDVADEYERRINTFLGESHVRTDPRAGRRAGDTGMTDPKYLRPGPQFAIAHLVEECGEVLAAAGKTQRWGLYSVNPELPADQQETNCAWLLRELDDLEGAIQRVRREIMP